MTRTLCLASMSPFAVCSRMGFLTVYSVRLSFSAMSFLAKAKKIGNKFTVGPPKDSSGNLVTDDKLMAEQLNLFFC